ncbi:uncharacterized protein [Choristoneura fumiferana]|uniref:uncharacterized protein n=1 Tax=Choristoneura fumiferana TaxID=7141 RepID=UPI003D159711
MASSQARLVLRQLKLREVAASAKALLVKCKEEGAPQEEFVSHRLKLRQCLELLEKEVYHLLNTSGDTDVSEVTQDQLEAEDTLTELETAWELSKSQLRVTQKAKLPELGLPTYDGDKLKWSEFWDRFVANVDDREIAESEKLLYLMGCLKGPALETISGLTATNANYSIAVDTLKQRFGSNNILIDAHYTALTNLPKADQSSTSCRSVLDNIERNLRVLEKLGEPVSGNHLRALVLSKFPAKVIHEHHLIGEKNDDLVSIRSSLDRIITAMERSAALISHEDSTVPGSSTTEALQVRVEARPQVSRKRKHSKDHEAPPAKRPKRPCLFCNAKGHLSADCRRFQTVEARQKKLHGRCLHCLRRNHQTALCRRKISCYRCKGDHLMVFCPVPSGESVTAEAANAIASCINVNRYTYLQTAVGTLQNPETKKSKLSRILLDCGSQRSYITRQAASMLNLQNLREDSLLIYTFGASKPQKLSSPTTVVDILTKRGISKQITVNIVPKITDRVPVAFSEYNGVDVIADDDTAGETVDLLIGNDCYSAILRDNKVQIAENLYLLDTDFGWVLSGNITPGEVDNALSVVTYCQCHIPSCPYFTEPDLPLRSIDVQFLWSLESIGITDSPKATRQEEAVRHFNNTVQYQNGRYLVKWPWIQYPPDLPSNFGLALGRLRSTLKRLDTAALDEYESILKEQLHLGIIEIVDQEDVQKSDHPLHYLPHHMVKQKGKKGRIVYDASAKTTGQKSLNECLYSGPSMLEDLTALLLKFRTKKIGLIADVEKAFLQVALQDEDRDVTRFLWLKDVNRGATEDNLLHFRFCRVPFGVISSPFLLTATIQHHMTQSNEELIKTISHKCYVDNLVTGANSVQEAMKIYNQTRSSFEQLSMNIRDWLSNDEEFMKTIPEAHKANQCDDVKVLGLYWNLSKDRLKLNVTPNHCDTSKPVDTKRKVLQALARVYDPCGFVCPLILPMKLIFQNICGIKAKWDAKLPTNMILSIQEAIQNLYTLADIQIPRYIGSDTSKGDLTYQLHCFTDASKNAYAAVVYLKVISSKRSSISFLMAKSHVSQAKDKDDLKIPKLELLGFLIGSRLLKYTRNNLELEIAKEYLWSDSMVVLCWMKSNKLLPPFVANRVNEIKRNHPNTEMCYINTKSNPADIATRPELFKEKMDLWYNGPEFLVRDESTWPEDRVYQEHQNLLSFGEVLSDSSGEHRREVSMDEEGGLSDLLELSEGPTNPRKDDSNYQGQSKPIEYSEYPTDKLMELDNSDNQQEKIDNQQVSDGAETISNIIELQKKHFPEELDGKRTHLARNLDLFLDVDGVLRCRGRMANTTWSYDKKYPILLPRNSQFTDKIIKDTHESNYHVGLRIH